MRPNDPPLVRIWEGTVGSGSFGGTAAASGAHGAHAPPTPTVLTQSIEQIGNVLVGPNHVRVDARRDARVRVAQPLAHIRQGHVLRQEERGREMPQAVRRQWWEGEAVTRAPQRLRDIRPAVGHIRLSRMEAINVQRLYAGRADKGLSRIPAQAHAIPHRACELGVMWGWLA